MVSYQYKTYSWLNVYIKRRIIGEKIKTVSSVIVYRYATYVYYADLLHDTYSFYPRTGRSDEYKSTLNIY